MTNVFTEFSIWPEPGENQNVTLQRMNWVAPCYILTDMIGKNYLRSMQSILMLFEKLKLSKNAVTVELKLEGQNIVARRDIEAHFFYHTGDVIKLDGYSNFRVKIKKRVFIEGEAGTTCRNYPNSDFQSYRECDDKYMRTKVDEVAPGVNLMPVWMTEDLSKATTNPVVMTQKDSGIS